MQTRLGIRGGCVVAVFFVASIVAACGGKVPDRQAAAETVPLPTVSEMNAWIDNALDPKLPVAEKKSLVQGVADPKLVAKVLELYSAEGAELEVLDVVRQDAQSIVVGADVNLWDEVHPQEVEFVFEDGKWKIEKDYACRMAKVIQLSSAACL